MILEMDSLWTIMCMSIHLIELAEKNIVTKMISFIDDM